MTPGYEPGLKSDLKNILDRVVPPNIEYIHHERWGDYNGHSHIRATLIKSSLTIPIINGRATLGTWQQVILIDLDVRPRKRRVILTIMGE
jgi:secondary thiamine-phosphate synthase enzyme